MSGPSDNRPTEAHQPDFYLTVVRGLEQIASAEVRRLGASALGTRPAKVFLRFAQPPAALLDLRCSMHTYAFIAERSGCPPDASAQAWLEAAARELHLSPALAHHAALRGTISDPSFRISAARSGEHDYTSPEIAAWVGAGVQAQTGWRVDLEDYDYDLEVELVGDRALFGLLLGPRWQERRGKVAYHPASLNPTVPYAMIQLLGLEPDDTFLDPACGGGTLLTERAALGPTAMLLGGDIWPRALEYARLNLDAAGTPAHLLRWDAGRLPLRDESVTRVASNLPFGHRVSHGPAVRRFYRRLLPELARVLQPKGRAALLTSRHRWFREAAAGVLELHPERRLRIVLGGKQAFIFILSR